MKNDLTDLTETELASETVFKGRLMHVKCDRVRLPNGRESSREYISCLRMQTKAKEERMEPASL